jgi:hypothetical protein
MLALPALVGPARLPHIEQQGVVQAGGAIRHEIEGRTLLGGRGPAPEGQGLGPQVQGVELPSGGLAGFAEQAALLRSVSRLGQQGVLMGGQAGLPLQQLVGQQG